VSTKSIKAFENAYPMRKPRPSVRLRNEASKIRTKAQSLLAQANTLDEMADELDGAEAERIQETQ
jgi:hypothetical protein